MFPPFSFLSLMFIFFFISSISLYDGSMFPTKYLEPEAIVPTTSDLEYYLIGVKKILDKMVLKPNTTDPNRALGMFYMRAILQRTLKESNKKIRNIYRQNITDIIKQADYLLSHFYYLLRGLRWSHLLKRVGEILRDDFWQVQSIGKFNSNRLKKWILSDIKMNKFAQIMDEAKLPKEKYLELIQSCTGDYYKVSIEESDECLGQIVYNPVPQDETLWPCVANENCARILYLSPSVAYSLSHRLLNIMLPRHVRRCYMRSKVRDDRLMNILCASMYRETVYLARRGYFYRDIFMEHVALCSVLGYKEFHRRHWFRKVVSWIDKDGCIQENMNFEMNRTKFLLDGVQDSKKREEIIERSDEVLATRCFFHEMSLAVIMLAHGIRHAVYFSVV